MNPIVSKEEGITVMIYSPLADESFLLGIISLCRSFFLELFFSRLRLNIH